MRGEHHTIPHIPPILKDAEFKGIATFEDGSQALIWERANNGPVVVHITTHEDHPFRYVYKIWDEQHGTSMSYSGIHGDPKLDDPMPETIRWER